MGISYYIGLPSITVADLGRGHNPALWEGQGRVLMHRSREEMPNSIQSFSHTQYECDKMGVWCLQRKIHKTELLLLAQICTKSFVGWGFAPEPTGELAAPQTPRWFRGWGRPGKGNEGGEGREREKERKEGEGEERRTG